MKVAYVYNFCRYVQWPVHAFNDPASPLVIGVLGNDPFGTALDELARRKTVKGRPIAIMRFGSWEDYQPCHVLLLADSTDARLRRRAVNELRGKPLLVIGETEGFAREGAAVNFYPDADGTVGFEINVDIVAQQQLQVDAKLLKLANVIRDTSSL